MKANKKIITDEKKAEIVQKVNAADDKGQAIIDAVDEIVTHYNEDLVNRVVEESERARYDTEYKKSLGLRNMSSEEREFYTKIKQGVTADQIDIIPTQIIDRTLEDIKQPSGILSLINFAPVGVKKWLSASKTGAAAWGNLTSAITAELTATITALNMDTFKLTAYCIIPKAIRELEIGYVDRYFRAILSEAMQDGIVTGYINGDGKNGPIGIMRQISVTNTDGTAKAKTKITTLTGFSPKQLAGVCKTLTNNGLRPVTHLYVLVNPLDEFEYVNPALYGDSLTGGYVNKSFMPLTVIADANVPQGTGILTLAGRYVMGFDSVRVNEYKETKALDDADVIIAKAHANGRADDDNTAVVFDVTKLTEYVPTVLNKAANA